MISKCNPHSRVFLYAASLVALIVVATPRFLDTVAACGHLIPHNDLFTDYVKGVLWAFVLAATILLWPVSLANKKLLLWGWLAKVVVALGLMLFYENHYPLDAYEYFWQTRKGGFSFSEMHLTNGTNNLFNLARLHRDLFPDSYHAMKLTFAMVGLIGIYLFYRGAVIFFRREDPEDLLHAGPLSGDPLMFLPPRQGPHRLSGDRDLQLRRDRLEGTQALRFVPVIVLGIVIATFIRQWLAVIMAIPLGVMRLIEIKGVATKVVIAAVVAVGLMLSVQPLMDTFKIQAAADVLEVADKTTKGFVSTAGGSTQALDVDLSTPKGIILFLPQGAFAALFRPLPGDVMNPFGMLAGLESSYLLLLLFLSMKRSRLRDLREPLVLWAVLFLAVWSLINGIVSSTNFGVAVRYKLQVLPLMLGLLIYLSRRRDEPQSGPLPRCRKARRRYRRGGEAMCGIAGFIDMTLPDPERLLQGMTDAIAHRGPDASGHWHDRACGVSLGHRRLSILDLSPAGSQPMRSHSGRFVTVFNGEIYNHRQIRGELDRTAPRSWRAAARTPRCSSRRSSSGAWRQRESG